MRAKAVKIGMAAAAIGALTLIAPAQADTTTSERRYIHGTRFSLCFLADGTENVGSGCWYVAPGAEINVSVQDMAAASETVGLRYDFYGDGDRIDRGAFCGAATLVAPEGAKVLVVHTQDPVVEQTYDESLRANCGGVPTRGVLTATGVLSSPPLVGG